jgi:urea ABC transporter ATP-binding protein UrtE
MLTVQGLHAGYGRIPILHGIDLTVAEGSFVGILGHNGMGKSTLLKTLIGLLRATAGRIEFTGQDVTHTPPHRRGLAGMGYVPQGRAIFAKLTVRENLELGATEHVASKAERERVIEDVLEELPRLKPILGRPGGVLSGGEQQILALARCFCGRPRLLMLDEPTEGIQPSIIEEIEAVIGRIKAQGQVTILLVEQYLEFAWRLADAFYLMEKGSIVAHGDIAGLTDDVIQQYLTV